jgi:hypothetical protein
MVLRRWGERREGGGWWRVEGGGWRGWRRVVEGGGGRGWRRAVVGGGWRGEGGEATTKAEWLLFHSKNRTIGEEKSGTFVLVHFLFKCWSSGWGFHLQFLKFRVPAKPVHFFCI